MKYLIFAVLLCACTDQPITDCAWEDSIHNPENEEFVVEVAFNLDIDPEDVTQEMFNQRYIYDYENN